VKVTVAMVTYRRAWALPHSLASIAGQTRRPDEVAIVLKPSGDGSEEVIRSFSSQLPIKLVVQGKGNFTDAVQMAIDNARGDIILFLDDDAVAEERWVEKYEDLFNSLPNVGGISGATYKAYVDSGKVVKTYDCFYDDKPTKNAFYRKPLPEYVNYYGWIARSGFMGAKAPPGDLFLSTSLDGVNMGLLRDAVRDCPLADLFKRSRKGIWNEKILAYCAKKKGRDTYKALGPRAPSAWHLLHANSLTRGSGFWQEFWLHYDRVENYWRLKRLGAQVSPYAYVAACLVSLRRRPLPRLLATLYGWLVRL
jgi:glycosyltransferase involved in cell wall biosynthesis